MIKNKGFTLIELLITISIITITLPALISVLMTINKTYAKTLTQLQLISESQYAEWSIRDKIKKPNYIVTLGASGNNKNKLLIAKNKNVYITDKLKLSEFKVNTAQNLKTVTYFAGTIPVTLNIAINHAQ